MLRHGLGLNSQSVLGKGGAMKDRNDHRHHAIDAVVVGLTDRGMLQRVTRAAKAAEGSGERLVVALEAPWAGFVAEVAGRAQAIVVSHKPDTGWQAALHNDTAYGAIKGAGPKEPNVVVRREIGSLAKWSAEDARMRVRDPVLAAKVAAALAAGDEAARKAALAEVKGSGGNAVRSVRTTERLDGVQAIADRRTGEPYKLVKRDGNHRTEIWRLPDGTIEMCVISTFDAARQAEAERLGRKVPDLRPHPAAKLVMRLHKNDPVAIGAGEERRIMRVVKMRKGQLTFAPHNEAGNLKARDSDKGDIFKYFNASSSRLRDEGARKLQVTPDGRVRDPGRPR